MAFSDRAGAFAFAAIYFVSSFAYFFAIYMRTSALTATDALFALIFSLSIVGGALSLWRTVTTHGGKPSSDLEMEYDAAGIPRYCSKCDAPKPQRSEHCKACKSCILRFDHHCGALGVCIGLRNQKFFMLFLFYSSIAATEALHAVFLLILFRIDSNLLFSSITLLIHYAAIGLLLLGLGISSWCFFIFVLVCTLSGQTTHEFHEGTHAKPRSISNLAEVFGSNFLLWPLPLSESRPYELVSHSNFSSSDSVS